MAERLGVIFDMDGVLVDSYQAHFASWRGMAAEHGQDMTEPQFQSVFGRTSREIVAHFWGDGLSEERIAAMDDRKEVIYRQIIRADFPEMDGAHELLAALRAAGFAVAIGSSGPPANIAVALERLGGAGAVDATVSGMEVTRGKPDPQVFLLAAGKLGVRPAGCAVVEDALAGLKAARSAGMAAIAITGTFASRELSPLADLVVDALGELNPERIETLIRSRRQP